MRVTAWLRRNAVEIAWGVFAAANWAAMFTWPGWETIPFHFVWISLTLLYGFRVWSPPVTYAVLAVVIGATGASIMNDAFDGSQLWGELFEVPLMSAMFLAMVWHARRRVAALDAAKGVAEVRASLLDRQQRFLHDASHELRTPVTIARGHLELLRWQEPDAPELEVALDELDRMERIIDRLLLLAKAEQPELVTFTEVDVESFLSDIFMRWCEVAVRAWRLDLDVAGTLLADPEGLRDALDALLENAVKYTEPGDAIELRARAERDGVAIEVADEGCGVPPDALPRIFERWARVDGARTREQGGAGLGLAIVAAIARAHGGVCSVEPRARGTVFALHLPVNRPTVAVPVATPSSVSEAGAALGMLGR
ncbi:MAG TPA: HAMP domain-containing sensor histidine kinase [Gaiellaceae bacterium]|nr:HAMP domain-containing sensor histidine kinase [Gaiellaceae bacterium]